MKLYYFRSAAGNFGDDLNSWMWPRVAPGLLDEEEDELFVGIGTLLNRRIPVEPRKIVFGSGAGYGDPPAVDERWKFVCVRGPLTARRLGLDPSAAVTDAAALIATLPWPDVARDGGSAFMPHCDSEENADWEQLCRHVGVRHIDPRWPVDRVFQEIRRSDVLFAEAMHGAIVADALRVPWVPVVCYEHILDFKWTDWTASLQLPYRPVSLNPVWDAERGMPASRRIKNSVKRALRSVGIPLTRATPPPPARSASAQVDAFLEQFARLVANPLPLLSEERCLGDAVALLAERLSGVRSGKWSS